MSTQLRRGSARPVHKPGGRLERAAHHNGGGGGGGGAGHTVDLEHGDVAVAVDLAAGGAPALALLQVADELRALREEGQRELAEVELLQHTARASARSDSRSS